MTIAFSLLASAQLKRWVGLGLVGLTGATSLTPVLSAAKPNVQSPLQAGASPSLFAPSLSPLSPIVEPTTVKSTGAVQKRKHLSVSPETTATGKALKAATPQLSTSADRQQLAAKAQQPDTVPFPVLRVLVSSNAERLDIAASTPAVLLDSHGNVVGNLQPNQLTTAAIGSDRLQIGSLKAPNGTVINPGTDGLVFVSGHWYRGVLQLVYDSGQLLAINWIDLEQYLYGAVGSEMPASWAMEALRSQAIAARSYALSFLAQPVGTYFDIGNDESFQVYKGVEGEAGSTIEAVESTCSLLLTQKGDILLAEYASTDAVNSSAHNGVGMSQTGALRLAQAGYSYADILQHYYPGSQLSLLAGG